MDPLRSRCYDLKCILAVVFKPVVKCNKCLAQFQSGLYIREERINGTEDFTYINFLSIGLRSITYLDVDSALCEAKLSIYVYSMWPGQCGTGLSVWGQAGNPEGKRGETSPCDCS